MSLIKPRTARPRLEVVSGGLSANFWRLWGSAVFANTADGVASIAMQLVAVRLGASPGDLAGLFIASRLPMLVLGLVAGGLADRLDRRKTMVAVQVLRVGVVGALVALAVTGTLSLFALVIAAFLLGFGETFFDTNAQSIVPMVAGRDRLVAANGRLFAAETLMGTFVGPPLGGFLVALSVPLALFSGAAGFALAAVGLVMMRGTFRAESSVERRSLVAEIGDGIRFLVGHRLLLTLTGIVALGQAGAATITLLPLYAVAPGPMGLTEPEFGLLFVTFGAGSLVGSFGASPVAARLGRPRVLMLAQLLFGLGVGVPALTAEVLAVSLGYFVAGVASMMWNVTNVSLRQGLLPPALMGRVHATHRTIAYVASLAGAALIGTVGEVAGLREAFAVGAGIVLLGLLGGLVVTERRIAEAEASIPGVAAT